MKANKALKRLTKIKALISDVTERYSASAPHLRDLLQYAEDAVTKAKEAVGLHVSSKTKGRAKAGRAAKEAGQKKTAVKKVVTAPTANTAKKSTPIRTAAKRAAAKKAAPGPVVEAATTKAAAL
jgi:fatty acid-binding protein DegV